MENSNKFTLTKEASIEIILNHKLAKVLLISNNHDKSSYFYTKYLKLNYTGVAKLLSLAKSLSVKNIPNYVTNSNYGLILYKALQSVQSDDTLIKTSELAKELNVTNRVTRRILNKFVEIGILNAYKVTINNKHYTSYKLNYKYKDVVKINIDDDVLKSLNYEFKVNSNKKEEPNVQVEEKVVQTKINFKPVITHTISNGTRTVKAYFDKRYNRYVTEDEQVITEQTINLHKLNIQAI